MTTHPKSQDGAVVANKRFDPSKFTAVKAKPLPVLLLLDVSGSMNEVISDTFERTGETVVTDGQTWQVVTGGVSRIQILNDAVRDMIAAFAREEQLDHEFLVSIITFGKSVSLHLPPTRASQVDWKTLAAAGETPLGEAIAKAKQLIEDKGTIPARAYRPVVILVSDGKPTDRWEANLESFVREGRSTKCDRLAIAIGAGADEDMLRKFIAGSDNPIFHASDAKQILDTFQRVTMSVTIRSKLKDPNQPLRLVAVPADTSPRAEPSQGGPSPPLQPAPVNPDEDGYW